MAGPARTQRARTALAQQRQQQQQAQSSNPNALIPATSTLIVPPIPPSTAPGKVKVPRPPNAWILYRSDKLRELTSTASSSSTSQYANMAQADISKKISQLWRDEDCAVKQYYENLALTKKLEHKAMFPNYRFQPMKKAEKERIRDEKKAAKERERAEARSAVKGAGKHPQQQWAAYVPAMGIQGAVVAYTGAEARFGPYGPSPPMSAFPSPATSQSSQSSPSEAGHSSQSARSTPISIVHGAGGSDKGDSVSPGPSPLTNAANVPQRIVIPRIPSPPHMPVLPISSYSHARGRQASGSAPGSRRTSNKHSPPATNATVDAAAFMGTFPSVPLWPTQQPQPLPYPIQAQAPQASQALPAAQGWNGNAPLDPALDPYNPQTDFFGFQMPAPQGAPSYIPNTSSNPQSYASNSQQPAANASDSDTDFAYLASTTFDPDVYAINNLDPAFLSAAANANFNNTNFAPNGADASNLPVDANAGVNAGTEFDLSGLDLDFSNPFAGYALGANGGEQSLSAGSNDFVNFDFDAYLDSDAPVVDNSSSSNGNALATSTSGAQQGQGQMMPLTSALSSAEIVEMSLNHLLALQAQAQAHAEAQATSNDGGFNVDMPQFSLSGQGQALPTPPSTAPLPQHISPQSQGQRPSPHHAYSAPAMPTTMGAYMPPNQGQGLMRRVGGNWNMQRVVSGEQ